MLADKPTLAKQVLEALGARGQETRDPSRAWRPQRGFETRIDKFARGFACFCHDAAQVHRFPFRKKVRPAAHHAVGVDGEEPGQTPRHPSLLDFPPCRRRIPRQLANPILLFACVEHLCV